MGYALLALAPIAVVFVLMVVLGRSAKFSMGSAYVVTALLALFVWGAQGAVVAAATVNGIVIAVTLLFIVFAAILLLIPALWEPVTEDEARELLGRDCG